jgi:hypothetical protein
MLEHYILYGVFIAIAVICSYRSGRKQGTEYGVDLCLEQLKDSGIIVIRINKEGEEIIYAKKTKPLDYAKYN